MCNFNVKRTLASFDEIFDLISFLETIIRFTKENCIHKELDPFNELSIEAQKRIHTERCDYVNMLSIALNKLEQIKSISSNMEEYISINFDYNRTPTIAADK